MRSAFRYVEKLLQVAAAVLVKLHTFVFKHELLFVVWKHNFARRDFALRIDHSMPWCAVRRRVHAEPDRARCVTIAQQLRDLAIRHHAARRDAPHNLVNTFAIFWISFFKHELFGCSQHDARWSAVALVAS